MRTRNVIVPKRVTQQLPPMPKQQDVHPEHHEHLQRLHQDLRGYTNLETGEYKKKHREYLRMLSRYSSATFGG